MIKIVVLSFGVWVSQSVDSVGECIEQAQRIFQLNQAAQVWCCDLERCVEQKKQAGEING